MSKMVKGSERKFTLQMKPIDGVHIADCRLRVEVIVASDKSIALNDDCIKRDDKDLDTIKVIITKDVASKIGLVIKLRVYIGIPDADFPDGFRDQIYEVWSD